MSIEDRHIVISGGGSGVGAELAAQFARGGGKVTILGRRQAPLDDVAASTGALAIACDVTDRPSLDAAIAEAEEKYGPTAVAIANAGAATSQPFERMAPDDLGDALAVNLTGVFNLWQATLPGMREAGWGRLIAIASTAGLKGYAYVTGYCAAKHGVVGLTRALALELARTGVTANAICPGFIATPMLERSIDNIVAKTGMTPEDAAKRLRNVNPQGRFIEPSEVGETALWLCTDGARSINGHALSISGGEI